MKFGDLKSGDRVSLAGYNSVILAIEKPHPLNPAFWLIVFYIFEEKRLSFDMLSPAFDLIPGTSVSQDGLYSYRKAMDELRP